MKETKNPIEPANPEAAQPCSNSPTEAGQADSNGDKEGLIDAINQTFTLFQLNYHNQFFSAFPDQQDQDFTKKLWLESLGKFTPTQILQAAKAAIEQCEYLPNLHRMIQLCQSQGPGGALPTAHDAYVEACNASSPKAAFNWTHPAVYHAAVETGWYVLGNEIEHKAFPLFEKNYQEICRRVLNGEQLTVEAPPQLEEQPGKPLSREESRGRAAELRKVLNEG